MPKFNLKKSNPFSKFVPVLIIFILAMTIILYSHHANSEEGFTQGLRPLDPETGAFRIILENYEGAEAAWVVVDLTLAHKTNLALFQRILPGEHTIRITDSLNQSKKVGWCLTGIHDYNCWPRNFSSKPVCNGRICEFKAWALANTTTTLVFKFTEKDTTPPTPPRNLIATALSFSEIKLEWEAATDNEEIDYYAVYRSPSILVGTTQELALTDKLLAPNTTYTYTVIAVDTSSNPSNISNIVNATTPESPDGRDLNNLCAGLPVNDMSLKTLPPLAKPAKLQAFVDPTFGTIVRRITAVSEAEGPNAVIKPMYSTVQAWNADESLMILWHRGIGHEIYDGKTYQYYATLPLEYPSDLEQVYWDPLDPYVLYYPSQYNNWPRLMKFNISTWKNELVRDFSTAPTFCTQSLTTGSDLQDMSRGPEKVIGLRCATKNFLYSIGNNQIYAVKDLGQDYSTAQPTYDGEYAYHGGNVYDKNLNYLRTLDLAQIFEHNVLAEGVNGPLLGAVDFDGSKPGSLVVHDLLTGAKKVVIGQENGYPYPPSGTHVTATNRNGPPSWFGVSAVGSGVEGPTLINQEIILANSHTNAVCRVAHHRSAADEGQWGYWSEPHLTMSPSGTRILFGSDWSNGNSVDTYVIELPSYKP